MINAVAGLVGELRQAGIPVSLSDHVDAVAALRFIDLGERSEVKAALGAALVKDAGHEAAYSKIFDLYFAQRQVEPAADEAAGNQPGHENPEEGDNPLAPGAGGAGEGTGHGFGGAPSMLSRVDDAELQQLLLDGLRENQPKWLRMLAQEVVTRYAGIVPGRSVAGTYYLFRTLRAIKADSLAAQLLATRRGTTWPASC